MISNQKAFKRAVSILKGVSFANLNEAPKKNNNTNNNDFDSDFGTVKLMLFCNFFILLFLFISFEIDFFKKFLQHFFKDESLVINKNSMHSTYKGKICE